MGDHAAQLAVAADRNGLQEVRHHHHGTDVGTIERDERAHVVDPVTDTSQRLVYKLCVCVVGHNFFVVVLGVKESKREILYRMILDNFLVQLNELPGGQNHHAANNDEQNNSANNTNLPSHQ